MTPYVKFLESTVEFFRLGHPITVFEIGVRRAVSTHAFLRGALAREKWNHRGLAHVYSCDIEDRGHMVRVPEWKEHWTFYHQASMDVKWDKEIDILLIDGEHTYKAVKEDYEKYEPFVRPGGLIILHDMLLRDCSAAKFWPEIKHPKVKLPLNFAGLGVVRKPLPEGDEQYP